MLARRLLTFVASLFVCLAATATTVEQRSPFTQGHWWDPTRSGHGFELLNAGGQVFMVWYTYDENGAPTWYTAQGEESLLGNPWPLMRHEWSGGRISRSTSVGQAWLRRRNTERIDFVFEIGGASGQWTLQPFRQSGVINEVDLTGHWYNPANNGWGMTLVDQGDVFGAVIYAYSASGAPTWVAGFDRGKGTRVDLYTTRGTCPTCPYKAITSSAAGSINIDYRGDTEITIRGAPAVAFASGVVVDGTRAYQLGRPSSTRRVDFQLAPFGTSEALKSYIVAGLPGMSFGGSDFSAGGGGGGGGAPSFSETNLQESGVDEADVLKTDGTFVYSLVTARTAGLANQVRIAHVGPGGSSLQAVGQFPVYEPPSLSQYQFSWAPGLYLHAGNLVTASTSATYWGGWYYSTAPSAETRVEIRSLASPAAPAVRWRGVLSGQYVGSRRVGDRLYVITRFSPNPASLPGYVAYPRTDADRATNAAVIAAAPVEAFLPTIKVDDGPALPAVIPSAIHAPQLGSNVQTSDMAVLTVIDVARAAVVDSLAIIGRTETLYVSTSNIYVASTRFNPSAMVSLPVAARSRCTARTSTRSASTASASRSPVGLDRRDRRLGRQGVVPLRRARRQARGPHEPQQRVVGRQPQPAHDPRALGRFPGTAQDNLLAAEQPPPGSARQAQRAAIWHPLRGRQGLRGDLPAGRSALCHRHRRQGGPADHRRARDSGLLGLPAPVAQWVDGRLRTRCHGPGTDAGHAGGPVRCLGSHAAADPEDHHRGTRDQLGPVREPPCRERIAAGGRIDAHRVPGGSDRLRVVQLCVRGVDALRGARSDAGPGPPRPGTDARDPHAAAELHDPVQRRCGVGTGTVRALSDASLYAGDGGLWLMNPAGVTGPY
jgi:hypothetical protein